MFAHASLSLLVSGLWSRRIARGAAVCCFIGGGLQSLSPDLLKGREHAACTPVLLSTPTGLALALLLITAATAAAAASWDASYNTVLKGLPGLPAVQPAVFCACVLDTCQRQQQDVACREILFCMVGRTYHMLRPHQTEYIYTPVVKGGVEIRDSNHRKARSENAGRGYSLHAQHTHDLLPLARAALFRCTNTRAV